MKWNKKNSWLILFLIFNLNIPFTHAFDSKGIASFYAGMFHGKKTASGEIYDMYDLTAAHLKFPFGTFLKVTNLSNNKWVIVKINDRGPYIKGRVIDLSKEAARQLSIIKPGVTKIKMEVLAKSSKKLQKKWLLIYEKQKNRFLNQTQSFEERKIYSQYGNIFNFNSGFGVQIGAFKTINNALAACTRMEYKGYTPYLCILSVNGEKLIRVIAGHYDAETKAKLELKKIEKLGYNCFIKTY